MLWQWMMTPDFSDTESPMVALRLTYGSERKSSVRSKVRDRYTGPERRVSRQGRKQMSIEAYPVDVWQLGRIEPALNLLVESLSNDGVEATSDNPLSQGRKVSLVFPTSPFLPASGTVAIVESCERVGETYRIVMAYEPMYAA